MNLLPTQPRVHGRVRVDDESDSPCQREILHCAQHPRTLPVSSSRRHCSTLPRRCDPQVLFLFSGPDAVATVRSAGAEFRCERMVRLLIGAVIPAPTRPCTATDQRATTHYKFPRNIRSASYHVGNVLRMIDRTWRNIIVTVVARTAQNFTTYWGRGHIRYPVTSLLFRQV